jgi:tetratricopeptide (TPR) repeat protein
MESTMTKFTRLMCFGLMLVLVSTMANAQRAQKKEEPESRKTVAMSQGVYEDLTAIQELVEAEDYVGADQLLARMHENEKLSPYEKAQAWNLSGYSAYLQEDYPGAIDGYENVMAQPDLPEALVLSTLKTMAQLQFTIEDYETALLTVRRLMNAVEQPSADIFMLEGQALFQMNRYDEALKPIKTAVDMFTEQGQVPRENWLLLLRVIYFEQKNYDDMILVVKDLIRYYPKDSYLLTLAGVYSELGDTKKQLALTEVLYERGYLNSNSHVSNLANLYLLHDVPYKAAQVLEKGINDKIVTNNERNLRLLSQAWYQAREDQKAIPPLKEAAESSGNGELYVRLAQAHMNLDQYKQASTAAQEAIRLGGLNREDQAQIMLGMALFNQKRLKQAKKAFIKAKKDERSARAAQRDELMNQDVTYKAREKDALLEVLESDIAPDSN